MAPTTGSAWSPSSPRTTACPNSEVECIEKALDEATGSGAMDVGKKRQPGGLGEDNLVTGPFSALLKQQASAKEEGEWQRKGATLSDKTARTELGLTQDEIVQAIRAGKLHYRHTSIFGNPVLRLLRREVEVLVKRTHGAAFLKDQRAKTELARINRELRRLTTQIAALEERNSKLLAGFTR